MVISFVFIHEEDDAEGVNERFVVEVAAVVVAVVDEDDCSCRLLKSTAARRIKGVVKPQAIPTRRKERM